MKAFLVTTVLIELAVQAFGYFACSPIPYGKTFAAMHTPVAIFLAAEVSQDKMDVLAKQAH